MVFLETTAVAERIYGLPETIRYIDSVCTGKTLLSSTDVWGEFRRTFLHDHVICHTVFVNSLERGEDFATALKRLPRFSALRYRPRKLRRAFDVVARLHEKPFDSLKEAVDRLENDIQYQLQICFFNGLHEPLIPGANCKMTHFPQQQTESEGSGYPKFDLVSKCTKRENPDCDVITFWSNHEADLKKVAAMDIPTDLGSAVVSELTEFKDAAKMIVKNYEKKPSEAFGTRCYAKIADLVICLECPEDVPIVTSNRNHYNPLCERQN